MATELLNQRETRGCMGRVSSTRSPARQVRWMAGEVFGERLAESRSWLSQSLAVDADGGAVAGPGRDAEESGNSTGEAGLTVKANRATERIIGFFDDVNGDAAEDRAEFAGSVGGGDEAGIGVG